MTPGSEQVVSVRSQPGSSVTIQVSYPNGDHPPVAERMTGDDGTATYAYVQEGSKILPNRYTAQVLVTATDGGALGTVTKTYRIGFGRVDISVAPWFQSSKNSVTIWIHTRAHARVTVAIYHTRTRLGQLKTTTNAQGWGHVDYKPRPGRVLPSHSPVVVQASTQRGSAVYSTQTTFVTP